MRSGWAAALVVAGLSAGVAQAGASHGAGEGGARPKSAPLMPLRILPPGPAPLSSHQIASLGGSEAFSDRGFGLPPGAGVHAAPGPQPVEIALTGEAGPFPFDLLTGLHPSQGAAAGPDGAPVQGTVPPALVMLALTTAALGLSAVRGRLRAETVR